MYLATKLNNSLRPMKKKQMDSNEFNKKIKV